MATVLPVYPTTRRNVELLLVLLAVVIAGGAWAVVGLTIDGALPPNFFAYAGGLGVSRSCCTWSCAGARSTPTRCCCPSRPCSTASGW